MRKILLILSIAFQTCFINAQNTIQSPAEFLGYELGDQFTRHHQVLTYFDHLDKQSELIKVTPYGKTYEQRQLISAIITSEANHKKLDQIQRDNLIRAGLESGEVKHNIPIVWLGYNVHGNESVSTEAAMLTAHELLTNKSAWLEDVVIIMDPCINPDGRERYVNFYWQNGHQTYNPDPLSMEHREPWLSGRSNHYMFDLNRDWAWVTQTESKARVKLYNQWLPHVAVDFHEQGVNNPYYFAPAAKPYHELLTDWQIDFQTTIGKNHAKYFDKNGWLYFTKQVFDLLYPSYGDTYPSFGGSIGMTYEQGGSGRAGLGVITELGDTLTLRNRIDHHFTTGLSTVEISYQYRKDLLEQFAKYYAGRNSKKSYVIKNLHPSDQTYLTDWLDLHQIKYASSAADKPLKAFSYQLDREVSISVTESDLIISLDQPKWRLIKTLFEQNAKISDSLTYDVTAWSLPYAFGMETYEVPTLLPTKDYTPEPIAQKKISNNTYAILAEWKGVGSISFLSQLLKSGVKVRVNNKPFVINKKHFNPGTIIITRRGNEHMGSNFSKTISDLARENYVPLIEAKSGFADTGIDLGSSDIELVKAPKVAMITGEGTSTLAVGATWYFMEKVIDFPFTALEPDLLSSVNLKNYDVLILQNGYYSNWGESELETIDQWVKAGGKLILIQNALRKFIDRNGYALRKFNDDAEKRRYDEVMERQNKVPYADRENKSIEKYISGAIFETQMDNTHPLGFGYDQNYFTLKTSSRKVALLDQGWNVSRIDRQSDLVSGLAGKKSMDFIPNSLVFGNQSYGQGTVIYMVDNPLFRGMWRSGYRVFANALFYVK